MPRFMLNPIIAGQVFVSNPPALGFFAVGQFAVKDEKKT